MKGKWKLQLRLWGVMFIMFILVWIVLTLAGHFLHINMGIKFWFIISILMVILQFIMGPQIVNMSMRVKEVTPEEAPHIHQIVEELAKEANIPKPKIGISDYNIPNAFAYGRSKHSGHVCVTRGILGLLDRNELKAVLGHEIGHIKHNDMAITTIVSVIPMICYYIALGTLFSRNNEDNGIAAIIGIVGFIIYFITQLLVLLVSRIREYYADAASVEYGNKPEYLASALYKLSYGAATSNEDEIKDITSNRAFFLNDVNKAKEDINSFREIDFDGDGIISAEELNRVKNSNINISRSDKLLELWSTHPDMLKRIKKLSELQ